MKPELNPTNEGNKESLESSELGQPPETPAGCTLSYACEATN